MSVQRVSTLINGKEYSIETGRFAKLADGAVMVRYGDTMILVTVCAAQEPKPDIDFMPLTVEYREKSASAGKIPGGFFRREGRPSEKEILSARLIDRPIRPMFPEGWRCDTQIIATVFSADDENEPNSLGMTGASCALMISNVPFNGPISEVHVGRVDGELVINPTYKQLEVSDLEITVAGTDESIMMVEGISKEISEDEFLEALEFAHKNIRKLNALQHELAAMINAVKREAPAPSRPEAIENAVRALITDKVRAQLANPSTKDQRILFRRALKEETIAMVNEQFATQEEFAGKDFKKLCDGIITDVEYEEMRAMIIKDGRRLDGRDTTTIRPIACEVGLLPRTHGSALFTRGETQSLTTVTLGTARDEQIVDGLLPTYDRHYMLHYNFPPFSTGETGRTGGTSRREIGHGNLAERALQPMMPAKADFPYTIRIVSDILESNGSSSMATVCAGSLACMDAGLPLKKQVAGIAMGLIKEGSDVAILSDILGDEDHLGDMDFKVAGTSDGITACQMDIKIQGLSIDIMHKALEQARAGRMHILGVMNETMDAPRGDLSPFAPRLTTIKIPVEFIGAVIGPGGEMIRAITKETNSEINIEDDGTITIAAVKGEHAQAAIEWIMGLIRMPEVGTVYQAKVKEVREGLGAIMEFLPKKQGLLHISQIAHERVETVGDFMKAGDIVEVKLIEVQHDGKFRLSRKALLPRPEGMPEEEERPRRERPQGDRPRGGGYDRDRRGPRR
ncbi:MAG: polyribonucleotide nucleotidyltransferase [Candidatus Kapaibacterium sp.]